jgi:hypothetical protein
MTQTKNRPNPYAQYATPRWSANEVGDLANGTLVAINHKTGKQTGDPFPELVLDDGDTVTEVWATQVDLKRQLAEKNPAEGDWLEIELVGFKQTAMGEMKLFRVDVTSGSGKRQSVPDAPPPSDGGAPPPSDGDVPPDEEEIF